MNEVLTVKRVVLCQTQTYQLTCDGSNHWIEPDDMRLFNIVKEGPCNCRMGGGN